jgi:hypothetical protein
MDGSKQIIRWSIPGWIGMSVCFLYWIVVNRSVSESFLVNLIEDLPKVQGGAQAAALLTVLGVPAGFVVYQLYHNMIGNVFLNRFVALDKGGIVLKALPNCAHEIISRDTGRIPRLDTVARPWSKFGFKLFQLLPKNRDRAGIITYRDAIQENWEIVRFYMIAAATSDKGSDATLKEYAYLMDIYNSLGATRLSALISWIIMICFISISAFINANSPWYNQPGRTALGFCLISALGFIFNRALTKNRAKALFSVVRFCQSTLNSYFVKRCAEG